MKSIQPKSNINLYQFVAQKLLTLVAKFLGKSGVVLSWLLVSLSANAQNHTLYGARAEDVSSIDGIMKAYYDVVSGPANTPRDIARDLSLHHPQAQIFPLDYDKQGKPQLLAFSIKQFHEWSKVVYDAGFYESEVKREVSHFGHSYQIWSTYETRTTPNGPVVGRGINNIQLYFDGQRYWIISETWDTERPGRAIPAKIPRE